MYHSLKIASRPSPLALIQIDEIIQLLKDEGIFLNTEIITLPTAGDIDKTTSLTQTKDNFFTDTLDQAVINSDADIAIHSAKDLPKEMPSMLKIFALTIGLNQRDAWVSPYHWKDLPVNPRIGTSSQLRREQILTLRPDAIIVDIRGTIEERIQLVKDGVIDGLVVAACALIRLKLESTIKDYFDWEATPLQGQLAVVGRKDNFYAANLFRAIDARKDYGKVTLIGAGPGDPDLITIKAIKTLESADCVFYDYLVDPTLLKYAPKAEHIYAGKRKGAHSIPQIELSRMLKAKAMTGQHVVRLKGGDPLIFGRGADEIQHLRAYHIEVGVIPGISSATGILSSLAIPLTARGIASSAAFLSGHGEQEDNDNPKHVPIPQADTLVFLMGLTKLSIILKSLQMANWPLDTPIMIISNGTKPDQQIIKGTLSTIENSVNNEDIKPPALMVVSKTLDLYQPELKLNLLHCGTHPELYGFLGNIIHFPTIDIKPARMDKNQQQKLLHHFEHADIIICTSWYAGDCLVKKLKELSPEVACDNKFFAVIGRRTAKSLSLHGITAQIVSTNETAQGLLEAILKKVDIKNKNILFPRSSLPNPFLKEALIKHGAILNEVTIYDNTKPPKRDLPKQMIDAVIFTSPSTVINFLQDYGKIPLNWKILAKGPVTFKTLQDAGYHHATALS